MSEEMKNESVQEEQMPTAEEVLSEDTATPSETPASEPIAAETEESVEEALPEKKPKKKLFSIQRILEFLQTTVDNKWVNLSDRLSRIALFLCFTATVYLGLIGSHFNFAFITLLITLATAFYVTLLAGARVILVRQKKRRIRKKAMRALVCFSGLFLIALALVLFSNIPYFDGRYGSPFHIHDYDAFYYDIIEDGKEEVAVIRSADSGAQTIMIPLHVNGYPLKHIDAKAFVACTKLSAFKVNSAHPYFSQDNGILYSKKKDVLICYPQQALRVTSAPTIIGSVTEIAAYAFAGSTCRTINMPAVTKIGAHAFDGCADLTSVEAPNLTSIGDYAFANCAKLRYFDVPETVTYVGDSAFTGLPSGSPVIHATAATIRGWHASWKSGCKGTIDN